MGIGVTPHWTVTCDVCSQRILATEREYFRDRRELLAAIRNDHGATIVGTKVRCQKCQGVPRE